MATLSSFELQLEHPWPHLRGRVELGHELKLRTRLGTVRISCALLDRLPFPRDNR